MLSVHMHSSYNKTHTGTETHTTPTHEHTNIKGSCVHESRKMCEMSELHGVSGCPEILFNNSEHRYCCK